MICIIDNYDSFSYNLYQYVGEKAPVKVVKNDVPVECVLRMKPQAVILSPGPGRPKDAGICREVVTRLSGVCPILGVCLGHQVICEAFGGKVVYAKTIVHGKAASVHIANGSRLFRGLPPVIEAARYHSLAAERETLPDELLVIAETDDGEVMGVKHVGHEIYGLQFHPESVLTEGGKIIIENFLKIGGAI